MQFGSFQTPEQAAHLLSHNERAVEMAPEEIEGLLAEWQQFCHVLLGQQRTSEDFALHRRVSVLESEVGALRSENAALRSGRAAIPWKRPGL